VAKPLPTGHHAVVSKVSVFCTFTCKDGKAVEMKNLLADMVEAAVNEPGIEVLSFHEGEKNAFWFFALLTNRAAIRQHRESFAARDFIAEFEELVEIRPRIAINTPMAAIGLDLDADDGTGTASSTGPDINLT
jgi:quinol monooxygenase YgiN